jgi:1-deoxy-D-xylulose-5-phosphate reductoisomerase
MNKGLELIEARWLFDCRPEQLEAVIHPQSLIHSFVEFVDGSVKAQMSNPDMRLPIVYALSYPKRIESGIQALDFQDLKDLTFQAPDIENFRNLALALEALAEGGNAPCVLNAANEIAVEEFLSGRLPFLSISEVVAHCLERVDFIRKPAFPDYVETDKETRRVAKQFVDNRS